MASILSPFHPILGKRQPRMHHDLPALLYSSSRHHHHSNWKAACSCPGLPQSHFSPFASSTQRFHARN